MVSFINRARKLYILSYITKIKDDKEKLQTRPMQDVEQLTHTR